MTFRHNLYDIPKFNYSTEIYENLITKLRANFPSGSQKLYMTIPKAIRGKMEFYSFYLALAKGAGRHWV